MSTYWGYHCKTDDETSPHWFNHGEYILVDAIPLWPHVVAINESPSAAFYVTTPGESAGPPGLIEWLSEHGEHDLELENEYGERRPR